MHLAVTLEHRFECTPDGTVWTEIMFDYPFWRRYLEVFDRVSIIARAREVPEAKPTWKRVDGERVSFCSVPLFVGPHEYLTKAWQVRRAIRAAAMPSDAVILRTPGVISFAATRELLTARRPFCLEIVADPYDLFAPGCVDSPFRPYFRWRFTRQLRRQCAEASGVSYVTEHAIQRRYPAKAGVFATHYSDVELSDAAFASAPRPPVQRGGAITLVHLGSFNLLYKGQDVLVAALSTCLRWGLDLRLVFVGDGRHRQQVEAQAKTRGLMDRVSFLGQLPAGEAPREQLDRADLFVLPSRAEGLPRAMIEAMARGLPCVGSTAGGIPELLAPEDMVPPDDAAALARKIREVTSDPERMARSSARNLERARLYHANALREPRNRFYQHVRETATQKANLQHPS